MEKLKIGVIGCGMISEVYLKNCIFRFKNMNVIACADILPEAAQLRASQFGIRSCTVDELLSDPEIQIVLNLTVPDQHAKVSMNILKAGKHVYSEKPLATSYEDGQKLIKYASDHQKFLGCAPDTFMGGGFQTCRKLIDDGVIGKPFAAQAFFLSAGPEVFHPNPEFFYKKGGGPILDWGPYYITALISLLGPIKRVGSMGKVNFPERKVLSNNSARYGDVFQVEVLTYVTSVLEFTNGPIVNLTTSFDYSNPYWESKLPYIIIYGSEGSISTPDTNKFEGPVYLRKGNGEPKEVPLTHGFLENNRGIGLSDMVHAIQTGGQYRANGELSLHVTEVMSKILESIEKGIFLALETSCLQPEPLLPNLPEFLYD